MITDLHTHVWRYPGVDCQAADRSRALGLGVALALAFLLLGYQGHIFAFIQSMYC